MNDINGEDKAGKLHFVSPENVIDGGSGV